MTIDQQQLRAIAFLATRMRPSGSTPWDEAGVLANLAKVAHLGLAEVVMATARAAANPAAKSPGVLPVTTGEHWREKLSHSTARPPTADEVCPHHPANRADNCGGCRADELAADTPSRPARSWNAGDTTAGVAACREALRNHEEPA